MKSPLRYQATRYDCGPTTMLNAIIFLFDREEIPPDLVRHIGICTLDSYNKEGHCGMSGTSGAAIRYFGSWLNELRFAGLLPARSEYLEKENVTLKEDGKILSALHRGDAVVLHVFHGEGHYILLTGICEKGICAFDPYYKGNEVDRPGIEPVIHHPHSHNVILPVSLLENTGRDYYSMGELWTREALIIGREPFENMYII
jgi:hypothetical protein